MARVAVAVVDDRAALLEGSHTCGPHHGEVEDDLVVLEELVLPEDADAGAAGDGDGALGRRLVAGEDLEERGLARPVGADEPVARARVELERHSLEEHAPSVGLGELGDADHGMRGTTT